MHGFSFKSLLLLLLVASSLAQQPKKPAQYFSMAGKRATLPEDNIENIQVVVSSIQSEGRMSMLESDWLPNFSVAPHFHKTHAETFYVISGQVEWTIGGETHVLGPGDAVHIPANTVHGVKVVGGKKMHSLMIQQPGGYEEEALDAATYTPAERKDPKVVQRLRTRSDVNPVSATK